MPTTSSPWASPSSPAGRRLLQSEPATADAIPVLDAAALALGAELAAATDTRLAAAAAPVVAPVAPAPCPRTPRRRRTGQRVLAAATLVVGLLAVGAAGLDEPAPASPRATAPRPTALGRAAGVAMADVAPPVAGGEVVVGLIAPIETMATRSVAEAPLAARLGTLAALAAEELPAP